MALAYAADILLGGLEAGGTKCVVGIGRSDGELIERASFSTTTPDETLDAVARWFQERDTIAALGIGTFGPADLDPASPTWGYITNTPKPGWSGTSIAPRLRDALGVPVAITTDVNAAALAEAGAQAGVDLANDTIVYVTIGTGIGGGAFVAGHLLRGLGHPEMGHMMLHRHPADEQFAETNNCPFHDFCAEGFVNGPAIKARWGVSLSELSPDHIAHEISADYIAQICVNLMAVLAPHRIILGGGVMQTPGLMARVRHAAKTMAGGYFASDAPNIIVEPACGQDSGIKGSIMLARLLHEGGTP